MATEAPSASCDCANKHPSYLQSLLEEIDRQQKTIQHLTLKIASIEHSNGVTSRRDRSLHSCENPLIEKCEKLQKILQEALREKEALESSSTQRTLLQENRMLRRLLDEQLERSRFFGFGGGDFNEDADLQKILAMHHSETDAFTFEKERNDVEKRTNFLMDTKNVDKCTQIQIVTETQLNPNETETAVSTQKEVEVDELCTTNYDSDESGTISLDEYDLQELE